MTRLRIGILGTRGIPNHYGGYEQAATFLSVGLLKMGHAVTVYNSHDHPYREKEWNGVEIVHCYDPEKKTGTAGQFIYDLNCIRNARRRNFDVLLLMGYTSSSLWGRFYPSRTVIISNMDGLEWKRSKYSAPVRQYLRYAEKLAVKFSDHFIADSPVIQQYLEEKYAIQSCCIPYGAEIREDESAADLDSYGILPGEYCLLVARMEPENNIEMILDGFVASGSQRKFIVVGNINNRYGKKLKEKFSKAKQILFAGAIFNQQNLHSLRSFSHLYFHGHSVGGTNPSLLEAMASHCIIAAHDNPFNKAVLGNDAFYFGNSDDVKIIINVAMRPEERSIMINKNLKKIRTTYNWPVITRQYNDFILECRNKKINE